MRRPTPTRLSFDYCATDTFVDQLVCIGETAARRVLTGVALRWNGRTASAVERTEVCFRPLTPGEVAAYAATGEGMDKAGSYAIQGRGALLVSGIDGDYFNVVGLPLCRLGMLLESVGLSLERLWSGL